MTYVLEWRWPYGYTVIAGVVLSMCVHYCDEQ